LKRAGSEKSEEEDKKNPREGLDLRFKEVEILKKEE